MSNHLELNFGKDKKDVAKKPTKKPKVGKKGATPIMHSYSMAQSDDKMLKVKKVHLGLIEDHFKIGKKLGSGAFSVVKSCTDRETDKRYAVKIINKAELLSDEDPDMGKRLAQEVSILKKVSQHKFITRLDSAYESSKYLYLVMEFVSGGELFDRIIERGSYSEEDARYIIKQIINGVSHLHENGIVHRDLKPENLLVEENPDGTLKVKISDFGLSKIVSQEGMMKTACGSPAYVAPEVLENKGYDEKVDAWSIGVILYILICGAPPFYDEDDNLLRLFELIKTGNVTFEEEEWESTSEAAKDLIGKLLQTDPRNRLSVRNSLNHEWFSDKTSKKHQKTSIFGRLLRAKNSKANLTDEQKYEAAKDRYSAIFKK